MASIGNWSSGTSPEANTWNSVCWSPIYNRFVAVSTSGNNRIMYSSNGINWSLSSAPAAYPWYSVVCSHERFVAIAIYRLNGIMYSSDGISNWQLGTSPSDREWRRACWSPQRGRFVAVGKAGAIVMYSDNGINWSISGITGAIGFDWLGVCWAAEAQGGIYVAVAEQGKVMISSNGINWTLQTDVINGTWWNVCWSPQLTRFVAVAHGGTNNVMYSSNGSNWLAASGPVPCNDVCWSPEAGSYIALASNGRRMRSTNGINWTEMTSPTTGFSTGLSIVWSPGVSRFVSVGYNTVMSALVTFTSTAPSAPTNLNLTVTNGVISATWTAPSNNGGSPIIEYFLYAYALQSPVTYPSDRTITSATINVISADYNRPFEFRVAARNSVDYGPFSTVVNLTINSTAPSAPQTLTAIAGNSQVILNWSSPASTGGSAILEYIVTRNPGNVITPTGSTATTRTITGLINTTYTFTVTARNAIGTSGSSNQASATPFTTPNAPIIGTVIAGNSNVTVTWSAGATNGSTRSGYIIQRSVDQNNWTNHTAGSNDISITISQLTNGTTYYFRVITQSNAGNSAPSSTLSAVPFTTPSAPTIGTAISLNASAIVNWTPLSQGSSDIITFTTVGSSVFTAPRSGTVEVLIVGGGGGGGQSLGGGGGGGGVIYIPSVNVTDGSNYTIVVGDRGSSSANGQNSSAFTSIAAGGGCGGEYRDINGKDGGCGGGAGTTESNIVFGGRGHTELVQAGITTGINIRGSNSNAIMHGFRGGNLTVATGGNWKAPGGGGAGAPGLDTNPLSPNDEGQYGASSGGQGISYNILGTSYFWAGGGGGGNWNAARAGWGGLGGGGGGSGIEGGPGGGSALNSGSSGGGYTTGGAGGNNTGGGGGGGAYGNPGGKGGSGIVVIRYNAASTNGSNITGYIVTDNFGVSTPLISGINTSTTTINGLTNGKTYTFKVKAVSSNAGNSIDSSPSNIVLPISPTPITTGSNFIGRTLVIGSTSNVDTNYARVVEFNNNSQNTYLGVMFSATNKQPWFSFRPLNQTWTEPIMNWTASLGDYYIYVFSFVSDIQVKYNIYEYNGTSTIIKGNGAIGAYNAASPFLQNLTQFWLGRTAWNDDMYSGTYAKIALYNGDLFALSQATILSTLSTLVQSTESNVYYNNLSNYAFRPVVNNFIGVVVNRLNYNITTGSAASSSNITLIRNSNTSGGYLNITGSFVELSTAPIIQTATVGPGNGQITVNWTPPVNNGGNISSYTVTSTPASTPTTVTGQTTLTAIVSGLTIGTSYTFRVVATNDAGTSPPSNASNSVTAATMTTVPSVPTNVTASSGPNIGEIKVSWIKPSNGGAIISEYQIRNFSTNALVATVYGETTETATVPSGFLTIGTSYRFTVRALNTIGLSNPSDPSTSITPLTFSFNGTQNYVGGKLDINHNYTQSNISFNWYSSINNSFTSPILLSNPNNRNYLFIRLEYQKLYIRCIVNFNTNTYTSSSVLIQEKYNPESFDYNITINTSGQKQTLFNTATYLYTSISTPPVFTFNLSLTNISSFLSSSSSLTSRSNSLTIINGLESSLRPFGERLLEIVAIKIFGHPKARAAISNDNSFYNITQLSTKVFDTLNNQRNELGNYYMGIYDIQPNSTSQTINVNNFNIIFPFFLNGATQKSSINLFRNGPNVGGSLLVNGQYNIPLLLTFI